MGEQKAVAIVVAAGASARMGFDKLMAQIEGVEVLRRSVDAMDNNPNVERIIVVAGANRPDVEKLFTQYPTQKPLCIVSGGAMRLDSVEAGLAAADATELVAIHDGARPFVSQQLITRCIEAAARCGAAAPAVLPKDTIKMQQDGCVKQTLPRQELRAVQTPQVFITAKLRAALAELAPGRRGEITDDCMVLEQAGYPVCLVEGEYENIKITTPEDMPRERGQAHMRVGHGYDVHRLVEGRSLILGGVDIPYHLGLLGHSDADALLHAVSDALLGAAALGDIGAHFPDSDSAYKGADSLVLLKEVSDLLRQRGYETQNIDATLACQAPKLAPHIPQMRQNIADALGVGMDRVSVKATTEEGLGFTGSGEGIAAHCVALIKQWQQR